MKNECVINVKAFLYWNCHTPYCFFKCISLVNEHVFKPIPVQQLLTKQMFQLLVKSTVERTKSHDGRFMWEEMFNGSDPKWS